jgi:flagellar capping protein FliD
MGDFVVRTIKAQVSEPIYSNTEGFVQDLDSFLTPAHIGFDLDSDGMLTFDSAVFDEAIGEDYLGVLALLGADKTGSSDSADVKFYGASSDNTAAGSYRVKIEYDGSGNLSAAYFKYDNEDDSAYRAASIVGNVIIGDSTFDGNGNPVYGENSLQLAVPTTGAAGSTVYATIQVKQGFTGAVEDALDKMLKSTTGSIQINQEHVNDQIQMLQDKIDAEEIRLEAREERLIARFARMEKQLSLLQSQMSYLGLS